MSLVLDRKHPWLPRNELVANRNVSARRNKLLVPQLQGGHVFGWAGVLGLVIGLPLLCTSVHSPSATTNGVTPNLG
eukprot:86667-Amphidinium_carterae.1